MPGAELDLILTNLQDTLLVGNPDITFFKASYKNVPKYAMEYKDIAQKGNINYLTLDQPTTFIFKLPYLMNNIDQEDENEFNQNIEYTQ